MTDPSANGPTITASREDAPSYRRAAAGGGGVGGSGGIFLHLLVVLLIAACCGLGWFAFTLQTRLDVAHGELDRSAARLDALEASLADTGRSLSEQGSETGDQLAFWESEIRKLWDVSNKRNKEWIEENRAAAARLDRRLGELAANLDRVGAMAGRHERMLGDGSSLVDRLGVLEQDLTEVAARAATDRDLLRNIVDDVNTMKARLASSGSGNVERIEALERWIESINAWRIDTNQRLQALGAPPA